LLSEESGYSPKRFCQYDDLHLNLADAGAGDAGESRVVRAQAHLYSLEYAVGDPAEGAVAAAHDCVIPISSTSRSAAFRHSIAARSPRNPVQTEVSQ